MQDELRVVPGTDCQLVLCGIEDVEEQVALTGAVWRDRGKSEPSNSKEKQLSPFFRYPLDPGTSHYLKMCRGVVYKKPRPLGTCLELCQTLYKPNELGK